MKLDRIARGVLSFARRSTLDGVVGHVVGLLLLGVLVGAWWVIYAVFAAARRALAPVVLLALLTCAGCAGRPCQCTCTLPPPQPAQAIQADNFLRELDARMAGKEQRDRARKKFLAPEGKTKGKP